MYYVLWTFEAGEKNIARAKAVELRGRQGSSDIAEGDNFGGSEGWWRRGRSGKGGGTEAGLDDRFLLDFGTCRALV